MAIGTAQKRSDTKSPKGFTEAEEVETLGSYDSLYKITRNVGLVRSNRSRGVPSPKKP